MIDNRYAANEPAYVNAPGLLSGLRNSPVTTESRMRESAGKALVTALLLTGDVERAEAAVLKSIGSMSFGDVAGDELIRGAVNAAMELEEVPGRSQRNPQPALSMLPFELQGVLHLPHFLRQCFVVRTLIGLPREACARLLHLDVHQVDAGARAAMLALPETQQSSFASLIRSNSGRGRDGEEYSASNYESGSKSRPRRS
jgi:hypothetical protein